MNPFENNIRTLEDLGYPSEHDHYIKENNLTGFRIGRVIAEHKERYVIKTTEREFEAEITGNMRFTARSREDFPAVGDWVALATYDSDLAIIHHILPRTSVLKRQAVGSTGEFQIIAVNIDFAFIVQAVDRDFNINRIERYLTICNSSAVRPLILLSKTDLINAQQLEEIERLLKARIKEVPVFAISNETKEGYEALIKLIEKRKTYCILGSSGVGKSTLVNNLSGQSIMRTDSISHSTNKGKHVTSHRELIILENGGILIDNPGMREVSIADTSGGLDTTFDEIHRLAKQCKFKDCTHRHETGCSVIDAIQNGNLDRGAYENYQKLEKELDHYNTSVAERRKKEKMFGKILKDYKKKDFKQRENN